MDFLETNGFLQSLQWVGTIVVLASDAESASEDPGSIVEVLESAEYDF